LSLKKEQSGKSENDPITPLIGTLQMDQNDLAENHDLYLIQALKHKIQGFEQIKSYESSTN